MSKSSLRPARTLGPVVAGHMAVYDHTGDSSLLVDGGAPGSGGITELTGDVTAGPGSGSQAATLANTAVAAGSYGSGVSVPVITVDAKGRLTSATTTPISGGGAASSVPIVVSTDTVLAGGTGWVIPESIEVAAGVILEVEGGARMEVTGPATPPALVWLDTIVVGAATTGVTFSGLDGNTDQVYYLSGRIQYAQTGKVNLEPNHIVTNQRAFRWNSGANSTYTVWTLMDFTAGATVWVTFHLTLYASALSGGVAVPRTYEGMLVSADSSGAGGGPIGGHWNETATNITSLTLTGAVAGLIGAGSVLTLYKFAVPS